MNVKIEHLALAIVAIVLIVASVQAVQLSGLNSSLAKQSTGLAAAGGQTAQNNSAAAPQGYSTQPSSGSTMVGGC
ncbi:MAG TPA: hypothetical protein VI977_01145 [archaeon]|nr:hypothetical protein [archaeon]